MFKIFGFAILSWIVLLSSLQVEDLRVHQVSRDHRTWYLSTSSASRDSEYFGVSNGKLFSATGEIAFPVPGCSIVRIVAAFPTSEGVLALLDCSVNGDFPAYAAYIEKSRILSVSKVCDAGAVFGSSYHDGLGVLEYHSDSDRTIHRFSVENGDVRRIDRTKAPQNVQLVASPDGFCQAIVSQVVGRHRLQLNGPFRSRTSAPTRVAHRGSARCRWTKSPKSQRLSLAGSAGRPTTRSSRSRSMRVRPMRH